MMRTATSVVTAGLLALVLSSPAMAGSHKESEAKGKSAESMGVMGKHAMSGTVRSVDHKLGWVELETGVGMLRLHYPPPALEGVEVGDTMTAELAFRRGK